jgi:hypothetical protein
MDELKKSNEELLSLLFSLKPFCFLASLTYLADFYWWCYVLLGIIASLY